MTKSDRDAFQYAEQNLFSEAEILKAFATSYGTKIHYHFHKHALLHYFISELNLVHKIISTVTLKSV
jgi:hypothetical protein